MTLLKNICTRPAP